NAFTPNGDGLNDVLTPLALGMKSVDLFMVYNRWGQLMFRTTQIEEGWNGKYRGIVQPIGTYVWYAEGTDYTNKKLTRKGTVILLQ
ncbi:MAG: gliding motility-associated C-terminal domain-containing protein, partial [Ferruginibacter sp.]